MCWLDRVVDHASDRTVCEARARSARGFVASTGNADRIPGWVALEWMAQTMAVHGALAGAGGGAPSGEEPATAVIAEVRELRLELRELEPRDLLRVEVVHERGERIAAFACRVDLVRDGVAPLGVATARVKAVLGATLG